MGRIWLFRLIPFVDFILVAGSMAMGNPCEDSDFDVIVGCGGAEFLRRGFAVGLFSVYSAGAGKVLRGVRARL